MIQDIESGGSESKASRSIDDIISLVESTNRGLGKDIERYTYRQRDLENFRFMTIAGVFAIYAVIALIFLQVTIDKGTGSVAPIFGEEFSKRIAIGAVFAAVGAGFVLSLFQRLVSTRSSLKILRDHLSARVEFAEQVLTRVTTWERKFNGAYYKKSILRLQIMTLSQLIDELNEIATGRIGKRSSLDLAKTLFDVNSI